MLLAQLQHHSNKQKATYHFPFFILATLSFFMGNLRRQDPSVSGSSFRGTGLLAAECIVWE
jgi:hypothetical protein